MTHRKYDDIVVGLDLGTSTVCAVVGEIDESGEVHIVGIGESPSGGLNKGVVVNIENTVESIRAAVSEAEHMAGIEISSVWTGIGGSHIKGDNSRGVIAITRKGKEITEKDRQRAVETAQTMNIPMDREIVHVLPREYVVDSQDGVKDPVGMTGVRLECDVHLVTAAVTSVQNIIKSVERAGLKVADVVLQPLASSMAVLTADERDLGVALIDIGGGTTEMMIFVDGAVWQANVLPLGGNQITNDVAVGLRTPNAQAEDIKKESGYCLAGEVGDEEEISVPGMGGRAAKVVGRRLLAEIIQQRLEEIFEMVDKELKRCGLEDRLPAGVVLTGGTARIGGVAELAEKSLGLAARVGYSAGVQGLTDMVSNPLFSTGVGLVLYGSEARGGRHRLAADNPYMGYWAKIKSWFSENF